MLMARVKHIWMYIPWLVAGLNMLIPVRSPTMASLFQWMGPQLHIQTSQGFSCSELILVSWVQHCSQFSPGTHQWPVRNGCCPKGSDSDWDPGDSLDGYIFGSQHVDPFAQSTTSTERSFRCFRMCQKGRLTACNRTITSPADLCVRDRANPMRPSCNFSTISRCERSACAVRSPEKNHQPGDGGSLSRIDMLPGMRMYR